MGENASSPIKKYYLRSNCRCDRISNSKKIMEVKTVTISYFRNNLDLLSRDVRSNKSEVIVTRHKKPFFKLIKFDDRDHDISVSFTYVRDKMSDFLDSLDENRKVVLAWRDNPRVTCLKL